MNTIIPNILAAAVLLASVSACAQPETSASAEHNFRVVTHVEGLMQPWSMAWLPNGDMLVTEKPGRLRIVRDGELVAEPVSGVPEVFYEGQGGLFDVVLHPDFENNNLVYLSFSKPTDNNSTTAVVRGRYENGQLTNVEEIFAAEASGRSHYGGRMAFDSNGYLFLTLGDRQASPSGDLGSHPAQNLGNHHGVIVRLHDDGSVPQDNPFPDLNSALPEIWSYGHRNPQGLAFHPQTGDLWETEHGPQGGDELNLIQPGNNYGWPVIGHGVNYGSGSPIHASASHEGMEQPVHYWVPSIATSGLMIYSGDRFPAWQGNIFSGGMAGEQLARLTLDENHREVVSEETLVSGLGRIRDVRQGPDGYIYLATEDRGGNQTTAILRLEPVASD